jgi:hypothetical protein
MTDQNKSIAISITYRSNGRYASTGTYTEAVERGDFEVNYKLRGTWRFDGRLLDDFPVWARIVSMKLAGNKVTHRQVAREIRAVLLKDSPAIKVSFSGETEMRLTLTDGSVATCTAQ